MPDNRKCYACDAKVHAIYDEKLDESFCSEDCHAEYLFTRRGDELYAYWASSNVYYRVDV